VGLRACDIFLLRQSGIPALPKSSTRRPFSVTQQFNTTTSMGRLTLNVLLSFAQFEREVIGERIRDKIAASKKKGMWMGYPGRNEPAAHPARALRRANARREIRTAQYTSSPDSPLEQTRFELTVPSARKVASRGGEGAGGRSGGSRRVSPFSRRRPVVRTALSRHKPEDARP
jgi:hypothetical protein